MARQHAYRPTQNNQDELMEIIAGSSMPTGRIFRLARENENLAFKETIQVKDSLTGKLKIYVLDLIK